jgi:glycosyltransferase involved in cell wall biosynthesis
MLVRPLTDRRPVLIASYSGLLGGAESVLLDCATRLARPAVVACPAGPLAEAARAAGLRHAPLAERSLRLRGTRASAAHAAGLAGLAWELGGLVHRQRPAALVAWSARAVLAASLMPRRPPLLAVLHDLAPSAAVGAATRLAVRRADGVVAASRAIAAELGTPATILHPGVDLAAFSPTPRPDGPPRALILGALVGWKRPELALEVAARMPELHLTVAGAALPGDDGRLAAALRERAAAPDLAGRVTLPGPVDARAALAAAHCLLHCADAEPYGLVLVEALACGRPVVAPAGGGPLEIVTDGAGRLYPPGDAGGAATALRAVLADPAAPAAARRRGEDFDVEVSAARLAQAVDDTIPEWTR